MTVESVVAYLESRRAAHLEALLEALRIPSVSTKSEEAGEVRRCAQHFAGDLRRVGFPTVELHETAGHPIVYAEWLSSPDKPTVLIYGHYDVQPPEPIEAWESPPFEPAIREGNLYARGSADDKGQVYVHLAALGGWAAVEGKPPINVKVILEGEEEIGSEHLLPFIEANREQLACDVIVISDTTMFAPGLPSLGYALRGITYCEVKVRTASTDLHSGIFGGAVPNAANVLCEIVAKLKDEHGRVTIPGFYDKVLPLTLDERQRYALLPFDEESFRTSIGISATPGEEGYSALERIWARPTLDVNGIWAGWTSSGAKTVIPAEASAKVSMRLVPDQDPDEIGRLFAEHCRRLAPEGASVEVKTIHGGLPFLAPVEHPAFLAAERALHQAFGTSVARIREGGSIPFVPLVTRLLNAPAILMGFGLPDQNAHAPNERLHLDNFYRGIVAAAHLYAQLAA